MPRTHSPTLNPPRPPEGSLSTLGRRCVGCGIPPPLIAGTSWSATWLCEDCQQDQCDDEQGIASMEDAPGAASLAN